MPACRDRRRGWRRSRRRRLPPRDRTARFRSWWWSARCRRRRSWRRYRPGRRASAPRPIAWRTAASAGVVRFERSSVREVIRGHTEEAGVTELNAKLARVCRQALARRPPGARAPEVVTPAVVREVLGAGAADGLPPAVREAIARERRRLGDKSDTDAERTNDWIEWLEHLPWNRRTTAPVDLARVRTALDVGHAGLGHAKACILEYLAVRRRNPHGAGAVLCFAGPPGVGKTSLAQCTAEALGRGYVKLACGGRHDDTDLRGHNRTWKDAQPGSVLRELRRVGSKDPVFVLDEIDKLGPAPAAVLLEVLDPEQNDRFRDAFVELPFDLSEVLFLTTANETDQIPPALREAMTVVEVPGYTEDEKRAIAAGHLLPLQLARHGLTADQVRVTGEAVDAIVRGYTRETGVWGLADALGTVCAKVVRRRAEGDEAPAEVTPPVLAGMLGAPAPPEAKVAGRTGRPGVAVGLCWTAAGGDVLVVEASRMPGSGGLALTGRLGEMMQESAQVALSWLRANAERYGIDPAFPRDTDVHLHVSGEAPKEGASPGVTMAAALVSVFTGRPLRGGLAMTGEITLSGQVLPVGGIRDKVLAAHRCGLTRVILPHRNRQQVDEMLGDDLPRTLEVLYVTGIDGLLDLALRPAPTCRARRPRRGGARSLRR